MYSPPSCTLNVLRASRAEGIPILDVRAPSEYRRGHIVGALSLPLFSDEERAAVGTTYVRKGEQAAIVQGLGYVGRHMEALATEALASASPQGEVIVYCARGGCEANPWRGCWRRWAYGFGGWREAIAPITERCNKFPSNIALSS